jgi:aminopeptidase-like protein
MSEVVGRALDGVGMHALAEELYPICRSITGNGVRQTLQRLATIVPLQIIEVPSGTAVLDWTVPPEWNIRDAWVATTSGERVIDFNAHSLHVVNYSHPIRARVSRDELERHLHSLPNHPEWIPYRTSYYSETWGFCVAHAQRERLTAGEYDVCIDSSLAPGSLTYGEVVLPGELSDEVLLSAHVCHPSLANDNLSGIAVLAALIQRLQGRRRRYTYRILFAPGTIGAIAWLARHETDAVRRIRHGLIVTCLGDRGAFTYKRSRQDRAEIDRVVRAVLSERGGEYRERPFTPDGYDERQYCSPGFDLPVGRLTRTPNGEYPEYHTSADNLSLIRPESLAESVDVLDAVLAALDGNQRYRNLSPKGEPQLGRRGLYRSLGGTTDQAEIEQAIRWMLNFSDGAHSVLDIAERSALRIGALQTAVELLTQHGLLAPVDER